jgi:hypothetical protein
MTWRKLRTKTLVESSFTTLNTLWPIALVHITVQPRFPMPVSGKALLFWRLSSTIVVLDSKAIT